MNRTQRLAFSQLQLAHRERRLRREGAAAGGMFFAIALVWSFTFALILAAPGLPPGPLWGSFFTAVLVAAAIGGTIGARRFDRHYAARIARLKGRCGGGMELHGG